MFSGVFENQGAVVLQLLNTGLSIQQNFKCIEYLYKLDKEYLISLTLFF